MLARNLASAKPDAAFYPKCSGAGSAEQTRILLLKATRVLPALPPCPGEGFGEGLVCAVYRYTALVIRVMMHDHTAEFGSFTRQSDDSLQGSSTLDVCY